MTKETRKYYGKLWKQGLEKCEGFEAYYNEFKDEIDKELAKEGKAK